MEAWFRGIIEKRALISLCIIAFGVLLPGSIQMPLLDRDEPRFSQATAEMMDRKDWIIPYFNDDYRFDKPPLTYWWMRVHYWILGKTEIGARLHSIFSTLIITFGIFFFCRKYFTPFIGWLSGVGWLTCLQVFQHGRLALADMPMVAAIFFANWALYELTNPQNQNPSKKWFWILWGSLGLGFLAKGPIALLVPFLTLALYRFAFGRKPLNWLNLKPITGTLIVLIMMGAWGIPALILTDGLFWDIGMGKHVIDRGIEAFNERPVIPFYYLLTAILSLFPWFAFIGKRFWHIRQGWDQPTAFLISWIISPYIIFLFYSTQLPHYVMPAFPALFIWLMSAVGNKELRWNLFSNLWFWIYAGLFLILSVGGFIWVAFSGLEIAPLVWGMAALFAALFFQLSIALFFKYRRYAFGCICMVGILISQIIIGSQMRALSPVIPICEKIALLSEDTRLVGVGFEEPSLVFYTGRVWDFKVDKEDLIADLQTEEALDSVYVILNYERIVDQMLMEKWGSGTADRRRELGLEYEAIAAGSHDIQELKGLNFARMRWSSISILIPKDRPVP